MQLFVLHDVGSVALPAEAKRQIAEDIATLSHLFKG
jgi:hypothetical protein